MAKRDNSKAGAKPRAHRESPAASTSTRERTAAPAVRSTRAKGAPTAPRTALPRDSSTQRQAAPPVVAGSHAHPASPGAVVSRRASDRLRAGHLWVYASDVVSVMLQNPEQALIPVADNRGLLLGTALYSPSSQIALRLVSRESLDQAAWLELLATRLRAAIARRKPLLDAANDACRLCFSEADELPGLVVDKYGRAGHSSSCSTKGLLARGVRETCVRVLREELAPAAILERPDPRIRELEGLPAPSCRAALGSPIPRSPSPAQSST